MSFRNPLYMQNSSKFSYAAVDDRFIIDTLFSEGVMNVQAGQGLVVQRPAGAAMQVRVPILNAIIKGDDATNQGSYLIRMDVAEDVDIPAASTTNPRIDLLVVEVVDSSYRTISTGGFEGVRLRVVAGTPAASPIAPALPATAIPLAQIAVAANASSIVTANITDQRTQSGAATLQIGTTAVPLTTTQRLALSNPITGYLVFDTTLGKLFTYGGAAVGWVAGLLDVQTFTTSGTWTKPSAAARVLVEVVSGGAGGGGSATGAGLTTPSNVGGSQGGGGGGRGVRDIPAFDLPATVSVTVGAGGAGGVASNNTPNQTTGVDGGQSSFGTYVVVSGGKGQTNSAPDGGGVRGLVATTAAVIGTGGAGGKYAAQGPGAAAEFGGAGGAGGNNQPGGSSVYGAGGGGSGGGGNTTASPGGAGGTSGDGVAAQGSSSTTAPDGAPGAAGTAQRAGGGGAGGRSSTSGVVGAGGAGGIPGGGGGGAGSTTGSASFAAGGAGARGEVRVYTLCI